MLPRSYYGWRSIAFFVAVAVAIPVICARPVIAAESSTLTKEQIKDFLLNAQIITGKQSAKGVTHPWRLTLSNGHITHEASFQATDEHKQQARLATGQIESNFVDSYKYNIAAYMLAELVGFDDMMPVYVEREWKGTRGSLSWWVPVMMDDQERYLRQIQPPNAEQWDRQISKIRVFNLLVYESDPNLTNILIGNDWKVWRIDFTRAFRLQRDLQFPKDLQRCDRRMLEKMKSLDANQLAERTRTYLTESEVQAVMSRRDKIVAHFEQLIADKGEQVILY